MTLGEFLEEIQSFKGQFICNEHGAIRHKEHKCCPVVYLHLRKTRRRLHNMQFERAGKELGLRQRTVCHIVLACDKPKYQFHTVLKELLCARTVILAARTRKSEQVNQKVPNGTV